MNVYLIILPLADSRCFFSRTTVATGLIIPLPTCNYVFERANVFLSQSELSKLIFTRLSAAMIQLPP